MLDDLKSQLQKKGEVTFSVKVRPSAGKTLIKGFLNDGTMKIDIAAVPEDGKANRALVGFLAQEFVVPNDNVDLVSGQLSRRKIVRVTLELQ